MTREDNGKVTRRTYPTAAFAIRLEHIQWIAKRAKQLGISKSEYVRSLIAADMSKGERAA